MANKIEASKSDWEKQISHPGTLRRAQAVAKHNPSKLGLFLKVYAGKASPRACIKAMCLECNGWEAANIRNCTAPACPLYRVRPYQVKGGAK